MSFRKRLLLVSPGLNYHLSLSRGLEGETILSRLQGPSVAEDSFALSIGRQQRSWFENLSCCWFQTLSGLQIYVSTISVPLLKLLDEAKTY